MTHRIYVKSTRLREWDYTSACWYFVTICTHDRRLMLGMVVNDEMRLSLAGRIVSEEWLRAPEVRANISLDEFVVMPNHVHGIIAIEGSPAAGAAGCAPPGRIYAAASLRKFAELYHRSVQIEVYQAYLVLWFQGLRLAAALPRSHHPE